MPSDDLVVVLVHGTKPRLFGRDLMAPPTWTKRDSPFRNILAGTLGKEPLFVEFDWSGANTHAARLSAAARLADLLRQLRREHPAARLMLIAHSHGGNVALYALRQLAPADRAARHPVDGLVCLGTPFLRATLGDLKVVFERLRVSMYWGVLIGLMALTLSLAFVLEQANLTAVKVAFVVGILAFICWKFGGKWLLTRYFTVPKVEAFMLKARGLAASVDCRPAFNSPPMFVVKSERDEAKLWLTLLDRSASLLSGERLLQWTSRSILAGASLFKWLESRGVPWALSVVVTILLWVGAAESAARDVKPFVYGFRAGRRAHCPESQPLTAFRGGRACPARQHSGVRAESIPEPGGLGRRQGPRSRRQPPGRSGYDADAAREGLPPRLVLHGSANDQGDRCVGRRGSRHQHRARQLKGCPPSRDSMRADPSDPSVP